MRGEGLGLAERFCGWLSPHPPSGPRTRRDDVTGSQSNVSSGTSREEDAVPSRAARKLLAYSKGDEARRQECNSAVAEERFISKVDG